MPDLTLPGLVLVGILQITAYQPVAEQTDNTPFLTSIGHLTHPFGAAVSQDLLKSGEVCYGDVVLIDGYGLYVINDAMGAYTYTTNPPTKQDRALDILVLGRTHESLIGVQHRDVWVLRSPVRACNRTEAMSMGMVNAKKVKKALEAFKKQHGREPNHNELQDLLMGRMSRKASHISQAYSVSKSDQAYGSGK